MKFKDLKTFVESLSEEQLECNVTVISEEGIAITNISTHITHDNFYHSENADCIDTVQGFFDNKQDASDKVMIHKKGDPYLYH